MTAVWDRIQLGNFGFFLLICRKGLKGKGEGILLAKILLLLFFVPTLFSCEDPIDLEIPTGRLKVVVEGQIDNSEGPFHVTLTSTTNFNDQQPNPRISDARVTIINERLETVSFVEHAAGTYISPSGWKPTVGGSYRCEIELPEDGQVIKSSSERLQPAPALDSLFIQQRLPAAILEGQVVEEFLLNAIITDPPGVKNFYRWQIILNGDTLRKPQDIILFSDRFVDGTTFEFQLSRMLFKRGDVVTVRHIAISENAFNYLNLIFAQATRLGQATGTAPATLQGNLTNRTTPEDVVLGYFSVVAYSERTIIFP